MATVVFHSSGVCPCEFVMLDKLWQAEQVSVMRSLASPSGNWTAARSCICSCPRAGKAKNKELAIMQVKSDFMDIAPPARCDHLYLRRRIPSVRYKKFRCGWPEFPSCPQLHIDRTTGSFGRLIQNQISRGPEFNSEEIWNM